MKTYVLRHLTVTIVMVMCVGTLVGVAMGQDHNQGTYYKPKHLKNHRGVLLPPGQNKDTEVIQDEPDGEILIREGSELSQNYALQPTYTVAIRSIPLDQYRKAMSEARTHYDVFRIFVPGSISDEDIDKMMWTMMTPPQPTKGHQADTSRFSPEEWAHWEATTAESFDKGQCGVPVPQIVRVRDILGSGDDEYYPSCVLRYKCSKDSGCCRNEHQVCKAIASNPVIKTVLAAKIGIEVVFENQAMRTFTVKNDTECGCVDNVAPQERPCPYPFDFSQSSLHCECRSASFKKVCKQIRRGKKPFKEDSTIRCMKEGQCRPFDNCYHGTFDMTTFQCPRRPDSSSGNGTPNVHGQPRPGRNRG